MSVTPWMRLTPMPGCSGRSCNGLGSSALTMAVAGAREKRGARKNFSLAFGAYEARDGFPQVTNCRSIVRGAFGGPSREFHYRAGISASTR